MIAKPTFNQLIRSLFYPNICIACAETRILDDQMLCGSCNSELPFTDHFQSNRINEVHERMYGRFNIEFGAALLKYSPQGPVQHLMQEFKYNGNITIGTSLARILAARISSCGFFPSIDLIVSVPLHQNKIKLRGFNQSEVLAEELSRRLHIKHIPHCLSKIIETDSQTTKTRIQRIDNVSNSIVINETFIKAIKGKHILIVDDTLTTGATIESCGVILLTNGAAKLSVACVAMAVM